MWSLAFIALGVLIPVYAVDGKCRVLALGGGTDHGAYTAGGIIGLIQNLPAGEAQWDVVTANGDGSINGLIVAQTAIGSEGAAASQLQDFWTKFSWSDFYEDWPGWLITGLFFQSGLYNGNKMYKTVDSLATGEWERFYGVGTTDLKSGGYVFFNNTHLTLDKVKSGIKATTSKAGIFQYVPYDNFRLIDGSIKFAVDIFHGINHCNDKGYQDKDIIVDVVMCNGATLKKIDVEHYKTLQVFFRYLAITSYDGVMQVVENSKHDHPEITLRSIIFPSQALDESFYPYDYSSKQLTAMIEQGIADAKKAVTQEKIELVSS